MKHNIRQRQLDPNTGLIVTKIVKVEGELGSGILDINGREIFEDDIVQFDNGELSPLKSRVEFFDGGFYVSDWNGYLPLTQCANLEVIGHDAED